MSTAINIIKAILVIISLILAKTQFKKLNSTLGVYWLLVATYWLLNLLQGLI